MERQLGGDPYPASALVPLVLTCFAGTTATFLLLPAEVALLLGPLAPIVAGAVFAFLGLPVGHARSAASYGGVAATIPFAAWLLATLRADTTTGQTVVAFGLWSFAFLFAAMLGSWVMISGIRRARGRADR